MKLTVCDGTGAAIPEDTPTTGHFGHQFSDEARVIAERYLADLNDLHTKVAERFQSELAELKARYREKLTRLPDEP